ncbi:MAG TPA: M28 family peptidase [Flavobacterium sp.]
MNAQQHRLYNDVKFLTEIRPFRNYRNTESLNKVCDYVRAAFKAAGLDVHDQKWTADGKEYTNVIGTYNNGKEKRLIVGAHYDVCGEQPGADDNASAVAGLLETARLLGENKPGLDYQIDLIAFCLEEPPFFASHQMGSYIHAKSLHEQNVNVIGMICYEMIGYFSDEPGSQSFPEPALAEIYPHTANFIIVVGINKFDEFNKKVHALISGKSEVDVQSISFPSENGLAGLSDQRNYWQFGYPALMINDTSFIRNPHYHRSTDTIETLDFEKMTEVVTGA